MILLVLLERNKGHNLIGDFNSRQLYFMKAVIIGSGNVHTFGVGISEKRNYHKSGLQPNSHNAELFSPKTQHFFHYSHIGYW